MKEIYLDAASTAGYSEVDDIIVQTMTDAMKRYWMNPSSLYASHVKEEIEKCRVNIAKFINAEPSEIYFTSGASESNNWAIRGWSECHEKNFIISTSMEHKSISKCINSIWQVEQNVGSIYCSNDEYGMVDLNDLEDCISIGNIGYTSPILVSVCMANNEIGTVQHIKMISDLVHKHDVTLHVDATQAFGHIPIDVKELGIDMMSVSGHKLSPVLKGIGFLYKKDGIEIAPLIYGNQEFGLRGGTENTFGIIGLNKAIEYCDVSNEAVEEMINKADYFINLLESKFGCKLNGHADFRLPNNINVTFPQNITGESLLYMLEMSGIYISAGSACNSSSIEPSHVLMAIGLTNEEAMRTVRFTLPNDIAYEDIDYVISEIDKALKLIELEGADVNV